MSKLIAKKYTQLFGVWKLKSYYSNLGFDGGGKMIRTETFPTI